MGGPPANRFFVMPLRHCFIPWAIRSLKRRTLRRTPCDVLPEALAVPNDSHTLLVGELGVLRHGPPKRDIREGKLTARHQEANHEGDPNERYVQPEVARDAAADAHDTLVRHGSA